MFIRFWCNMSMFIRCWCNIMSMFIRFCCNICPCSLDSDVTCPCSSDSGVTKTDFDYFFNNTDEFHFWEEVNYIAVKNFYFKNKIILFLSISWKNWGDVTKKLSLLHAGFYEKCKIHLSSKLLGKFKLNLFYVFMDIHVSLI